jgi:hypothetical protein
VDDRRVKARAGWRIAFDGLLRVLVFAGMIPEADAKEEA